MGEIDQENRKKVNDCEKCQLIKTKSTINHLIVVVQCLDSRSTSQ